MSKVDNDSFVSTICSQLDSRIAQDDPVISTRLEQIRSQALARHTPPTASASFVTEVSEKLNQTTSVPASVSAQLDASRKHAVQQLQRHQSSLLHSSAARVRYLLDALVSGTLLARPANRLATACVMLTAISLFYVSQQPASSGGNTEDLALLASTDDFELVENLDFYLWLAETGMPD